jgi:hypothetical protein
VALLGPCRAIEAGHGRQSPPPRRHPRPHRSVTIDAYLRAEIASLHQKLDALLAARKDTPLLGMKDIAAHVSLSVRQCHDLANPNITPDPLPVYRLGGKLCAKPSELDAWNNRRLKTRTRMNPHSAAVQPFRRAKNKP